MRQWDNHDLWEQSGSLFFLVYFNEAVAWWLGCWITNPEVSYSKPLDASKIDSSLPPSDVDQTSTTKSRGLGD